MKRKELFREFQRSVLNAVQTEAVMCGLNEYSVTLTKHRTEVTVYVGTYYAQLVFYISGRVLVKTYDKKNKLEYVISDKSDKEYIEGKCSVPDLISRYIFDIFDEALLLKNRRREDMRERREQRNRAVKEENEAIAEPITFSDENYLDSFDEVV